MISATPRAPYYAVIFTSIRAKDDDGYESMAKKMVKLAQAQPGFLGVESVREEIGMGITVSYWKDLESIAHWKMHAEHREAQRLGKEIWYKHFKVRICKVESDYAF
jgi:heme-degrading monooxygenase HmoA